MNRRSVLKGLAIGAATAAPAAAAAASPGQRISSEKGDPGERLFSELCEDGKTVRVYLDGVEQRGGVVMADPERGIMRHYVRTPAGNLVVNHATGELYTEEVSGVVRWVAERRAAPLRR